MNEEFNKFLHAEDNEQVFPNDLPSYEPSEQELAELHEEACKQTATLDKVFGNDNELPAPPAEVKIDLPDAEEDDNTTIDEETGEVTTITKSEPKIKPNPNGGYKAFYLAPANMNQRISDALNKMIAEGDTELAEAMQTSKKTIEGCLRYLNNILNDLGRELKLRGLTAYDEDDIHYVARNYFVNPDCKDVQNVAKTIAENKAKKTPKAEKKPKQEKPKAEPKPKAETKKTEKKPKTKVIPLTEQMGSLFTDDMFD